MTSKSRRAGVNVSPAKRTSKPKRRPTAFDRGQHELICKALKVSPKPNGHGNTAYEAVCELLYKVDVALAAKTLPAVRKILKIKPGGLETIPFYGLKYEASRQSL